MVNCKKALPNMYPLMTLIPEPKYYEWLSNLTPPSHAGRNPLQGKHHYRPRVLIDGDETDCPPLQTREMAARQVKGLDLWHRDHLLR